MFMIPKLMISSVLSLAVICTGAVTYADADMMYEKHNEILYKGISDYTRAGYTVPDLTVAYVGSLGGNVLAKYTSGVMYVVRTDDNDLLNRIIRHELAHAVTEKLVNEGSEGLTAYREARIDGYEPQEILEGLTAEERDYQLRLNAWYAYTLTVEELVAEDLYYSLFKQPTLQVDTLGLPTKQQIESLRELIASSLLNPNGVVDEEPLN